MKTKNIIILSACLLISGIVAGWFIRKGIEKPMAEAVSVSDTLVVRDTVRERYPVYVERTVTDTMLVAMTDTVRVSDTVYVRLPREQRIYRDTNYAVWLSGFRPSLDSIEVYPSTRYITKTVYRDSRKWGIGIQAGYGIGLNGGKVTGVPYIGIGISYDLIRF